MDENDLNFFNILLINQNLFIQLIYILFLLLVFYFKDFKKHFNE